MGSIGRVVKVIGGFCFVETASGSVLRCVMRGKLKASTRVLPGDLVAYELTGSDSGIVVGTEPRVSCLSRPAIANVTQVVTVITLRHPALNLSLLDRTLVLVENMELKAAICVNKSDLYQPEEPEAIVTRYRSIGYPVVVTSARTGVGLDDLVRLLRGEISVFSGRSGVGKSSLLNAIDPRLRLRVGELGGWDEGRHTTRSVELFRLEGGGYVADAPGFQRLELDGIPSARLGFLFREIAERAGGCRFRSCLHRGEDGCAVAEAVRYGEISSTRYENYLGMLEEIMEAEEHGKWLKR